MPSFQNPHEGGFTSFRNHHRESAAPLPGPSQRHNGRAHSLTNSGSLSFQKIVPTGPFPGTLELSLTWSPWPGPSDLAPQPGGWVLGRLWANGLRSTHELAIDCAHTSSSAHELVSVDAHDTPHPCHLPKLGLGGQGPKAQGRVLGVKRPPWLQCPFGALGRQNFGDKRVAYYARLSLKFSLPVWRRN